MTKRLYLTEYYTYFYKKYHTISEIHKKLNSLDKTKGPSPDGIPLFVLKCCQEVLADPLTILFNQSIHPMLKN